MPETSECPNCQKKLQIPEEFLGKLVRCPACKMTFTPKMLGPSVPPPISSQAVKPPEIPFPKRRDYDREDNGEEDYGDEFDDEDTYEKRSRRRVPHRGSTVLVLGILSLLICGPILGPIAWIMGSGDLEQMRRGRMDPSGDGITRAGKICGMIGTILSIVILCIYGGILILAAVTGGFR